MRHILILRAFGYLEHTCLTKWAKPITEAIVRLNRRNPRRSFIGFFFFLELIMVDYHTHTAAKAKMK